MKSAQSPAADLGTAGSDTMNGAESLIRTLVDSGVEVCFANPGTSELHFVAALDRVPGIRGVLGLFEGVVTGAADGYARMAGKPAATLLHLGPGLANGLANLHNARKAPTPIVNIIGNHATTHQHYEAPLTSDVPAFAHTVSHWVCSSQGPQTVAADAARAVQAARAAPGQVASLILPADAAWLPADRPAPPLPVTGPAPVSERAITQAVEALRDGSVTFLMRGAVLRGRGLEAAGRIAAATGARLVCDTFSPRLERGAGRVAVPRLPYRPAPAIEFLRGTKTLILVGTQAPVAFFGYPDLPSELTPPGCRPLVLSYPHEDGIGALEALAEAIGARGPAALGRYDVPDPVPDGPLTAEAVVRTVVRLLPEGAIISDESLTAGFQHYRLFETAAPHDCLQITGGAIGLGIPMALGAAIACPDRKVVSLQADGSGMYTLQGLWSQARERADVTTIVYANRTYKVLNQEMEYVASGAIGPIAASMLNIGNPDLNWVHLAQGMGIEAVRVDTVHAFADAAAAALKARGPRLIEAVID
jgi:acetolactate synthase-1/2/3 large subunit